MRSSSSSRLSPSLCSPSLSCSLRPQKHHHHHHHHPSQGEGRVDFLRLSAEAHRFRIVGDLLGCRSGVARASGLRRGLHSRESRTHAFSESPPANVLRGTIASAGSPRHIESFPWHTITKPSLPITDLLAHHLLLGQGDLFVRNFTCVISIIGFILTVGMMLPLQ